MLLWLFLLLLALSAQAYSPEDMDDIRSGPLPFRLLKPFDYTASRLHPLVLFLHGSGEMGTDNWIQVAKNQGFLRLAEDPVWWNHLFIVAPQCPGFWACWNSSSALGLVKTILDTLIRQYSIDTHRIYVTGKAALQLRRQ